MGNDRHTKAVRETVQLLSLQGDRSHGRVLSAQPWEACNRGAGEPSVETAILLLVWTSFEHFLIFSVFFFLVTPYSSPLCFTMICFFSKNHCGDTNYKAPIQLCVEMVGLPLAEGKLNFFFFEPEIEFYICVSTPPIFLFIIDIPCVGTS